MGVIFYLRTTLNPAFAGMTEGATSCRGDRHVRSEPTRLPPPCRCSRDRRADRPAIVTLVPGVNRELLVLATGAGSLILSHVNDAGFWLVKQYFNLSLAETFKTWTAMETIISVVGIVLVMALSTIV